jgi:hypothetical protein
MYVLIKSLIPNYDLLTKTLLTPQTHIFNVNGVDCRGWFNANSQYVLHINKENCDNILIANIIEHTMMSNVDDDRIEIMKNCVIKICRSHPLSSYPSQQLLK